MEKGVRKDWTPEDEARYQKILAGATTFAERYIILSTTGLLKYDLRTKAAKRHQARLHLMLASATDDEVEGLEALYKEKLGEEGYRRLREEVPSPWELRDKIRAEGVPRDLIARGEDA